MGYRRAQCRGVSRGGGGKGGASLSWYGNKMVPVTRGDGGTPRQAAQPLSPSFSPHCHLPSCRTVLPTRALLGPLDTSVCPSHCLVVTAARGLSLKAARVLLHFAHPVTYALAVLRGGAADERAFVADAQLLLPHLHRSTAAHPSPLDYTLHCSREQRGSVGSTRETPGHTDGQSDSS